MKVGDLVFKIDHLGYQAHATRLGHILEIRNHDRPFLIFWFHSGVAQWEYEFVPRDVCWLDEDWLIKTGNDK